MPTASQQPLVSRSHRHDRRLAHVLIDLFRRQYAEVAQCIRAGQSASHVLASIHRHRTAQAQAILPLLAAYWREGGEAALRDLAPHVDARAHSNPLDLAWKRFRSGLAAAFQPILKDETTGSFMLGTGFDVFDQHILEALRQQVFHFLDSMNETTGERLRAVLAEGLEAGASIPQLTAAVQGIFNDPQRALTIAMSETSRAVHAGGLLAAKETRLDLLKEAVVSGDACPLCLTIEARGPIPLDEDYAVVGVGPYARLSHPPFHPGCFCSQAFVLA